MQVEYFESEEVQVNNEKQGALGPKATVAAIAILGLLVGILLAQCSGAETPPGGEAAEVPVAPGS